MKKRMMVVLMGFMLFAFGCSTEQTGASYVKPVQITQEMAFFARELGVASVVGEIKRPAEGRAFTFVVKERQPNATEWTTHYVGTTYVEKDWQPQAERLAIFFDNEARHFRVLTSEMAARFTLDLPATLTDIQYSWGGGFPELNELPLNQFVPVVLFSVGNEAAATIPDATEYEKWETNKKHYDYVIGIEISENTTKW